MIPTKPRIVLNPCLSPRNTGKKNNKKKSEVLMMRIKKSLNGWMIWPGLNCSPFTKFTALYSYFSPVQSWSTTDPDRITKNWFNEKKKKIGVWSKEGKKEKEWDVSSWGLFEHDRSRNSANMNTASAESPPIPISPIVPIQHKHIRIQKYIKELWWRRPTHHSCSLMEKHWTLPTAHCPLPSPLPPQTILIWRIII